MPKKPKRACNYPGCPEVTDTTYCDKHDKLVKQRYDKERETAVQRGYTTRWRKIRKMKKNANPLCEICEVEPKGMIVVETELVHHMDKNSQHHEWDNLQSLCRPCHDEIHKGDRFHVKDSHT